MIFASLQAEEQIATLGVRDRDRFTVVVLSISIGINVDWPAFDRRFASVLDAIRVIVAELDTFRRTRTDVGYENLFVRAAAEVAEVGWAIVRNQSDLDGAYKPRLWQQVELIA